MADSNYSSLFRSLGLLSTTSAAIGEYKASVYNYKADRQDARGMMLQADDAIMRGQVQVLDEKIKGDLTQGDLKADAAARGVEVDTGSAADLQASASQTTATEQNRESYNAFTEARTYRQAAANKVAEAKNQKRKGFVDSISTFLGGVGKYASSGRGE